MCSCFSKYKDLLIDRRNTIEQSNMTTKRFIKEIIKNKFYKITTNSLEETIDNDNNISLSIMKKKSEINKIFIKCDWQNIKSMDIDTNKSNILGKSGKLYLKSNISVPIIGSNSLHYYNVKLYNINDIISFDHNLPLFEMEIGKNYVDEYIMKKAGGVYLEEHERPHFHMPLTEDSCGYMILGKKVKGGIELSAFTIPYGEALYMPNNIIHNDCFLIGNYNVIYSKTPNYKTVLLVNNCNIPIKLKINKIYLL
jgi:hypothetical protein